MGASTNKCPNCNDSSSDAHKQHRQLQTRHHLYSTVYDSCGAASTLAELYHVTLMVRVGGQGRLQCCSACSPKCTTAEINNAMNETASHKGPQHAPNQER